MFLAWVMEKTLQAQQDFFLAHPNVVSTEFCSWVFAFNLGNVIANKYK